MGTNCKTSIFYLEFCARWGQSRQRREHGAGGASRVSSHHGLHPAALGRGSWEWTIHVYCQGMS